MKPKASYGKASYAKSLEQIRKVFKIERELDYFKRRLRAEHLFGRESRKKALLTKNSR